MLRFGNVETKGGRMSKILYATSLLFAVLLIFGSTLTPGSTLMSLASTAAAVDAVRGVLVAAMIALLLTRPPRHWLFRACLGVIAVVFAVITCSLFVGSSMHVLDMLLFAEAAIAFGLAALEIEPEEETVSVQQDELAVRAAIGAFQRGAFVASDRLAMVALQPAVLQVLLHTDRMRAGGVVENRLVSSWRENWQFRVPFAGHQT
jgi:hypothetical protein